MTSLFGRKKESEPVPLIDHLVVEPVTYRGREMYAVRWFTEDEPVRRYDSKVAAWDHACRVPFHETNTLPKIGPGGWFLSRNGGGSWTSDPRFAVRVDPSGVSPEERERIDAAIVRFIRAKVGSMDPLEAFFPDDIAPTTLTEADGLVDFEALARMTESAREWVAEDIARVCDVPPEMVGTSHDHAESVPGCFRCDLSSAETPVRIADNPSESLSGAPEGGCPAEPGEAVRSDESDSEAEEWETTFWEDHARDYADDPDYRAAYNFLDLAENAQTEQGRAYWLARWEELA